MSSALKQRARMLVAGAVLVRQKGDGTPVPLKPSERYFGNVRQAAAGTKPWETL